MSDDSDSPDYSDFAVPATSVSAPVVASGGDYSDFAAPSAAAGDPAVYTLLGEAGTDPKGQLAVASTIFNRMNRSGAKAPSAIVTDPANGYEAWQNPGARARVQSQFPPGSPEYQAAAATLGEVTSGKVKPLPYDSFYSPTAQAALGRSPPAFDDGSGVNVGGNVFFTGKYQAPTQSVAPASAGMTETQAEAAYDAAHSQGAASAPITRIEWDPKTETYRDNNGTPYQRTGQTTVTGPNGSQFEVTNAPAEAGKVPIRPLDSGTGTSATPNITAMVADEDRKAAAAGLGQGLGTFNNDVSGLNAFLVNHVPTTYSPQDKAYFNQQVASEHANRFLTDTQFAGDPYYGAAKTAGQIGVTAPLLMAGGAGLGAASDAALSGTAFAPVADFIGGAGSGNLLTRGASLASRGALEGAAAGAIASGGNDQPFMQNVGTGAIAGGVLGPTVPAIGSTVSHMFGGGLLPAVADLADTAVNKYGIPLRVGQIKGAGGNRAAAVQDSNDISRFGTGFAGNNAQQWENFAKGVTRTYGDDSGVMTPANMQAARSTIGSKIGSIAARNTIGDADQVMNDIGGVIHNASQYTTDQQIAPMLKLAQNIGSVVDAPSVTGAPSTLSGQAYSKLIAKGSPLDRAMNSSDSAIRSMAGDIRDALDDGFERSISPQDLRDFQSARFQYKNLMTIADIAKKANVEGQISPQLLAGAVNKSFKNRAFSGAGDLGELSDIAQTFMKEPPNSGSAARGAEMLKNMFVPGVAGGIDAGLAFHDPMLAAQLAGGGAALAGTKFAGQAIRGALARSPTMRNMLINGPASNPVGNAVINIGNLAQPAVIPAGVVGANSFLTGHYSLQALLPQPANLYAPNPPAP